MHGVNDDHTNKVKVRQSSQLRPTCSILLDEIITSFFSLEIGVLFAKPPLLSVCALGKTWIVWVSK